MRIQLPFAVLFVAVFACSMHAAPAQAQRVFVSATGSDSNPCTFASPCRSFQHAHDTAGAGGEIDVLDPAGYGAVTITKAISIQGHGYSGISVASGANGITINAGTSDKVNLNGLLIDGATVGQNGVVFNTGGSLTIENSVIRNVVGAGVYFVPSTDSSLFVSNTQVSDNGGDGIAVFPTAAGVYVGAAIFNHVEANNNGKNGIAINTARGTNFIQATAFESVAAGNNVGFNANAAGDTTYFTLFHCVAVSNFTGIVASGVGASFSVEQSNLDRNFTNSWQISSGGSIYTYGDNYANAFGSGSLSTASKF
jgi:hypothetical protein